MKTSRTQKFQSMRDAIKLSRDLVAWFRHHKRNLPWRNTRDPYAILVSEMMLHQTTVTTVLGYYDRFLARFPTVQSLAAASDRSVMEMWAGLGYYRRAKLLHEAAKAIVREHGGTFPQCVENLVSLPGVGPYTAGAVVSFAFDKPAPIVEANTARVLARLFAVREALDTGDTIRKLWQGAERLVPLKGARLHNYALMELGALVCLPSKPQCGLCPISYACLAYQNRLVARIPPPKKKIQRITKAFACIILKNGKRYLIREIPAGEWHAGLYEFPKVEVEPSASKPMITSALSRAFDCNTISAFAELKYVVTKHAVTLYVFAGVPRTSKNVLREPSLRWMTLDEIGRLPLGSAQKKLVGMLRNILLVGNGSK